MSGPARTATTTGAGWRQIVRLFTPAAAVCRKMHVYNHLHSINLVSFIIVSG